MSFDLEKSPQVNPKTDDEKKKRLPVYILILAGIFLIALIFYMFSDRNPKVNETPLIPSNSSTEPVNLNQGATATDDANSTTATAQ